MKPDKVTHKPFDAAEFLIDAESQAAALKEALESGHKGVILSILGAIARARGMTALAKETGLGRQALYAALSPEGNPTLDTLLAIVNALGLQLSAELRNQREREPA